MDIIRVDSEALLSNLLDVDYSFMVQEIADPPFEGPDIVNTRNVNSFQKVYSLPIDGYRSHVSSSDSALFLGIEAKRTVGFIAISLLWNGMAQIDDLAVDPPARHSGIGSALLARAIEHSLRSGASGIRAETQSLNVPACRFYRRHGFELCGFDRGHYGPHIPETALFWHLLSGA